MPNQLCTLTCTHVTGNLVQDKQYISIKSFQISNVPNLEQFLSYKSNPGPPFSIFFLTFIFLRLLPPLISTTMLPLAVNDRHIMLEHAYQDRLNAVNQSAFASPIMLLSIMVVLFLGASKISYELFRSRKMAHRELLEYQV